VILGIAAAVVTLSTFFFRAWANWRSGRRVKTYAESIRASADRETERLKAEMEAAQRMLDREREKE